MRVTDFKVAIPQWQVDDLQDRLRRTRWPDQLEGVGWSWGADLTFLRRLVTRWSSDFDWPTHEARLNTVPQYRAEIDGSSIHYVHVKGQGRRSIPLLLSHGWPGSFAEMLSVIPLLTTDNEVTERLGLTFDVVVPSLPGFGFSSPALREGMSPASVAEIFHRLMQGLGYRRFGVQGGDLGAGISMRIALTHPESVIGVHTNFPSFAYNGSGLAPDGKAAADARARRRQWAHAEGGYSHMHETRPQTLGYALNDSPVGLAAWILEKFYAWSDRSGSETMPFRDDELLTNLSIYWFTSTITSSMRIYRESAADPLVLSATNRIEVPYGVASFPFELPTQPRERVQQVVNLVRWTEMPSGGHFAALEEPVLLARDVTEFFAGLVQGGR